MKGLITAFQRVISSIVAIVYAIGLASPSAMPKSTGAKNNRAPVVVQQQAKETENKSVLVLPEEDGDAAEEETAITEDTQQAVTDDAQATDAAEEETAADGQLGGASDDVQKLSADAEAPEAEETAEAPAEEANEAAAPEAVETWDVSATENDHVTMSYYDTDDAQTLLDQLAGCIKSLFVPMTAYAATDVQIYDDGDSTRNIRPSEYENGTVVVSGTGNMVEAVYNEFVDIDKFVSNAEKVVSDYYGVDVEMVYDEALTDLIEIDSNARYYVVGEGSAQYPAGTEVYLSNEICDDIVSTNILKYSPKTIIIEDGVENVSDYAFIFCGGVETIILPESVKTIGTSAFAYCTNLETIELPSGLETIGDTAFMHCKNLKNVVIPESVTTIGEGAFMFIANNSVISFENAALAESLEDYFYYFELNTTIEVL